jgi:ATP-dependent Clp protease ATP-binding subunit ClpC
MAENNYSFKFTKTAKEFLAKEGYDSKFGARPIKRAIQKYVEDIVADAIIEGQLIEGKTVTITKERDEDKLIIK